ncbi:putative prefoldin subunit 4 [Erysiphe necator]|uniref:Prefoldin subunit 4 n=1 Tax=Uncinula necator TaxID=52586 RepID=A0A0B1P299_UNCNE|nr:putative prefoldin subunit 4 [Erysiphe necator]
MTSILRSTRIQPRMLSKEEEARTDEVEVRREDQDKINKFSRLHHKEISLGEQLNLKLKEKEELDDVSNELELNDEDDKILYKIGDCFVSLQLREVQELLEASTTKVRNEINQLEEKLSAIRGEMSDLKIHLYARFGPSINLET